jgi:hypothetical protein
MKKLLSHIYFICSILLFGSWCTWTSVEPLSINIVTFKNDITSLHQLDSHIIKDLRALINSCLILVNGQVIKKGQLVDVPVINGKCTITIIGRLDFFDPIFNLNLLIKVLGRFISSHLVFSYQIDADDLVVVNGHDSHIDISNIIIDLVDKYDLWEGSPSVALSYKTEFLTATRSAKITIIDPKNT